MPSRLSAAEYSRRWRARNPGRALEYEREYRRAGKRNKPYRYLAIRDSIYKRLYGITLADYDRMLAEQDQVCAICKRPQVSGRAKYLAVDHDHATGVVRGLLCTRCNSAVSWFEGPLRAAVDDYLKPDNGVSVAHVSSRYKAVEPPKNGAETFSAAIEKLEVAP